MTNMLIIHGHFYQPPRENPWTGLVPHQDSAHPYHDWNEKITKQCYAANSMSRILNSFGQITDIVNNYKFISFNFGPTLIKWLKENANYIYKNILEADKESIQANEGHGNAIAQGYNHTILPLCSKEDAITQIKWGIKDFEYHFNRKPEGMWLPETGVSPQVLDILINEEISFIILSPWQAEAICPIGSNKWNSLHNNPIPTGRAYRIDRPQGSIGVFFYNHILSTGISFEHDLRNADKLYEKILSFKQNADPTYLVNIATDGEIYGHHEPFGDMCLAALTKQINQKNDFKLINYGRYLELFPPTYLVKLKEGERGLGTSWSCVHGVARWYRNCGCTTGGHPEWNQEWRTPLREAFSILNDKLRESYIKKMMSFTNIDPFIVRNEYIDVLTGKIKRIDFAKKIINKEDPEDQKILYRFYALLESRKYSMFMFTSCGWFFSEISGIEAMQNMRYAIKALDLNTDENKNDILAPFLSELENARSNISTFGSGRNIVESIIIPQKKNLSYGAAIFILSRLCTGKLYENNQFGIFKEHNFTQKKVASENGLVETTGRINVSDLTTYEEATYSFIFKEEHLKGIFLTLKPASTDYEQNEIKIYPNDLPIELRTHITNSIASNVIDMCLSEDMKSFNATQNAIIYLDKMHAHTNKTIIELAELFINRHFEKLFNDPAIIPGKEESNRIKELVLFAKEYKLAVDIDSLKMKISALISYQVSKLTDKIEEKPTKVIIQLLETCREFGSEPEITKAQNKIFQLLKMNREYSIQKIENDQDFTGLNRIRRLIKLGAVLGFDVEQQKEKFFKLQ